MTGQGLWRLQQLPGAAAATIAPFARTRGTAGLRSSPVAPQCRQGPVRRLALQLLPLLPEDERRVGSGLANLPASSREICEASSAVAGRRLSAFTSLYKLCPLLHEEGWLCRELLGLSPDMPPPSSLPTDCESSLKKSGVRLAFFLHGCSVLFSRAVQPTSRQCGHAFRCQKVASKASRTG